MSRPARGHRPRPIRPRPDLPALATTVVLALLAPVLRAPDSSDGAVREAVRARWQARADRGAEDRLALESRDPLAAKDELDRDPHLEMHTRGG